MRERKESLDGQWWMRVLKRCIWGLWLLFVVWFPQVVCRWAKNTYFFLKKTDQTDWSPTQINGPTTSSYIQKGKKKPSKAVVFYNLLQYVSDILNAWEPVLY